MIDLKILHLNLKPPGILSAVHSPSTKCTLGPLVSLLAGTLEYFKCIFLGPKQIYRTRISEEDQGTQFFLSTLMIVFLHQENSNLVLCCWFLFVKGQCEIHTKSLGLFERFFGGFFVFVFFRAIEDIAYFIIQCSLVSMERNPLLISELDKRSSLL